MLVLTILTELDHAPVSPAVGNFHDDVAQQDGVAVGPGGIAAVHQIELAVGGVVHVAVFDTVEMGAALEVVSGQAGMDLAKAHRHARSTQVQVVIETRIAQIAVVVNDAVLDPLVDGGVGGAIAVGHHAHVVVMDGTVADSDVIGLIDPHARTIVTGIVCAGQFEAFQYALVGRVVELKDGARMAAAPALIAALAGQIHPGGARRGHTAKGEVALPH
jgi:hypothetical protein